MRTRAEFYAWFRQEHNDLHTKWSAEVGTPGYDKEKWIQRERIFHTKARELATSLGIEPPYI